MNVVAPDAIGKLCQRSSLGWIRRALEDTKLSINPGFAARKQVKLWIIHGCILEPALPQRLLVMRHLHMCSLLCRTQLFEVSPKEMNVNFAPYLIRPTVLLLQIYPHMVSVDRGIPVYFTYGCSNTGIGSV